MVSSVNSNIKTPIDDPTAALMRSASTRSDGPPAKDASTEQASQDAGSRGPAVQLSLSALADLVTRQSALDALGTTSDGASKALSDQLQSNTDALTTLDQARKSTAADRKKDAEEKLQAAQKKLQILQILGGDPAKMAKDAKEIGKDIKDAASQYSTAMKDAAAGSSPAAAASQAVPGQATTAPVAGVPTGDGAATADGSATPATSAATGAPAATAQPGTAPDAATANAAANPDAAGTAAPSRPPVQSAAEKAAEAAAKYKLGQHDRDVVASFKQAANQVKQVMQDAAQKQKSKNPLDPGVSGTTQVAKEMDKAVQELSDTVQIQQSGGDISDTSGPDLTGPASPTIDILA